MSEDRDIELMIVRLEAAKAAAEANIARIDDSIRRIDAIMSVSSGFLWALGGGLLISVACVLGLWLWG